MRRLAGGFHEMMRSLRATAPGSVLASLVALAVCTAVALAAMGVPLFRPLGRQTSEQFGYAVSGKGDFNGDGFKDVVVGAPLFDSLGAVDRGRVLVYFGGPVPDEAADLVLLGAAAHDNFGWSLAVGDVNGDSFADILVGAPLTDSATVLDRGSAYLYLGGPVPNNVVDLTLKGQNAGDHFGWSVGIGRYRGSDSFGDMLVGAPLWDNPILSSASVTLDVGAAYEFYGNAVPDAIADLVLQGEAVGDQFGYSVAVAPDINLDTFDDIVIGAPLFNNTGTTDSGKGYVYFGDTRPGALPSITYTGAPPSNNGHFGWSVAGLGSYNGGAGDVIIGAPNEDPAAGADAGKAYVYYNTSNAQAFTIKGAAAGDSLGWSVAGAGDVDANGFTEAIVGSLNNDGAGSSAGRADVYFGGAVTDSTTDVILLGEHAGDQFGTSVASAGDVDNNGTDEVIVGAPLYDGPSLTDSGRAYIYLIESTTSTGLATPLVSRVGLWAVALVLGILLVDVRRRRAATR